jgi:hypothetical protein
LPKLKIQNILYFSAHKAAKALPCIQITMQIWSLNHSKKSETWMPPSPSPMNCRFSYWRNVAKKRKIKLKTFENQVILRCFKCQKWGKKRKKSLVCSSHTYRRSIFKIVFHMRFIARLTKSSRDDRHFFNILLWPIAT